MRQIVLVPSYFAVDMLSRRLGGLGYSVIVLNHVVRVAQL